MKRGIAQARAEITNRVGANIPKFRGAARQKKTLIRKSFSNVPLPNDTDGVQLRPNGDDDGG